MKIQYKLLLMLILAFGMVIFSEQDCFATSRITVDDIPKDLPGYEILINELPKDKYFSILIFQNSSNSNIIYAQYSEMDSNEYAYDFLINSPVKYYGDSKKYTAISGIEDGHATTNNFMHCLKIVNQNGKYVRDYNNYPSNFSFIVDNFNENILFSTGDVYKGSGLTNALEAGVYYKSDVGSSNPEKPDKLNLYELNLTDLDYNNQVHQFNLATYTDSPCYDEIMEYYNKNYQYAIYVTDYRRTLTYGQPDNDDSFQYGSYNLSGYIDFLVHDKGVFYYDKSENQMKTGIYQTEATIKPTTEYTKRFYFNAVYSEDSNDPNCIIFDDNGNLGQTYNLNNMYAHFIGSSQTIYYCAENGTSNIATKGIVTRIDTVYYKGYLNPWGNIDKDKVRDISTVPFYVYNFKFAGGTTNLLFSNSPTYTDDISNIYSDLNGIHNSTEIVPDSSEGGSYVQGIDSTSSTYEPGKVTNDTTNEQDKEHEGGIRVPGVTTEDRSNWTILDYVKNIFTTILNLPKTILQGLSSLFGNDDSSSVVTSITETTDTITGKFSFKDNLISNANEIRDFIVNTQETHKYYLNINHKYLSGNICIIDLSWYEPYKPTVDAFICAFAYLAFMWHMFKILPSLISGASAGSYVSEISTYSHTGDGRSANIHNRKV